MTTNIERAALIVLAGLAAYGLAGAFWGLSVSSFWVDELWTAWVVGADHDWNGMLSRALLDGHPPAYSILMFGYAQLFGVSEVSLRMTSALAAVASVMLFVHATRRAFSLPARLFAAIIATTSWFWFYQSQNARSYSLGMLIGAALIWVALHMLETQEHGDRRTTRAFVVLAVLSAAGAALHFYMLFVALAVIAWLLAMRLGRRLALLALATALTIATFVYVKLVVSPNSAFLIETSWMQSGFGWYAYNLGFAMDMTVKYARVFAGFLIVLAVISFLSRDRARPSSVTLKAGLLCAAVPVLVTTAGMVSSELMSPNFTDRNLLLTSPFIWGAIAFAYDLACGGVSRYRAAALVLTCIYATVVVVQGPSRAAARNTPFRESAAEINATASCRGKTIPVFLRDPSNYAPRAVQTLGEAFYSPYLDRRMRTETFFVEDVMAGRARPMSACPIAGWGAHFIGRGAKPMQLARRLAAIRGTPITVRAFHFPYDREGGRNTAYLFIASGNAAPSTGAR